MHGHVVPTSTDSRRVPMLLSAIIPMTEDALRRERLFVLLRSQLHYDSLDDGGGNCNVGCDMVFGQRRMPVCNVDRNNHSSQIHQRRPCRSRKFRCFDSKMAIDPRVCSQRRSKLNQFKKSCRHVCGFPQSRLPAFVLEYRPRYRA